MRSRAINYPPCCVCDNLHEPGSSVSGCPQFDRLGAALDEAQHRAPTAREAKLFAWIAGRDRETVETIATLIRGGRAS